MGVRGEPIGGIPEAERKGSPVGFPRCPARTASFCRPALKSKFLPGNRAGIWKFAARTCASARQGATHGPETRADFTTAVPPSSCPRRKDCQPINSYVLGLMTSSSTWYSGGPGG
jgi:hypothetical protein